MSVLEKYVGHGVKKIEVAGACSMHTETRQALAIFIWKQITSYTCKRIKLQWILNKCSMTSVNRSGRTTKDVFIDQLLYHQTFKDSVTCSY